MTIAAVLDRVAELDGLDGVHVTTPFVVCIGVGRSGRPSYSWRVATTGPPLDDLLLTARGHGFRIEKQGLFRL